MTSLVQRLSKTFEHDNDFFAIPAYLSDAPAVLVGFKSLIDVPSTKIGLQQHCESASLARMSLDRLKASLGDVKPGLADEGEAIGAILKGKLLICFEDDAACVIADPVPKKLDRQVDQPTTENVLHGSFNAFIEDSHANIGILRKQVQSEKLRVHTYVIGSEETTSLSLLYYDGKADPAFIAKVKHQIESNRNRCVRNLQGLARYMGFNAWRTLSNFTQTELPEETARYLRDGRAVLLLDQFPIAFVLPGLILDAFFLESDRNMTVPLMVFMRSVRFVGVMATLILPALYVALVSVNPEVLRIELAVSIAQSREGIPYPVFLEIVLMLIILELIIEASARLPQRIGPTITMVGGIILGQAVVQAKLVSNILIIILAAVTIANSTIVGLPQTIALRSAKYMIVVLAALFGVMGILEGLALVCAYLASLTTYGVPYVSLYKTRNATDHG
ncbi:GerA spore germination protein [Paenibacillus sp. UNC496MF]|uniref:spore germination protein n=1 Tax=Paenibacillus sp. UNC496MF TaxID=1502753 RepID=UPI0008DFA3D2|nr:spore germination protein [Paenibacillus sp. UNC496MF]SFI40441.1 GerA spore germination protein [Paenibacillus sp. UNC496MF]